MPRERLYVKRILPDDARVIGDQDDAAWEAVLKPGQWRHGMSRDEVYRLIADNQTSGDPRTQAEQEAMETAHNAQTGEAHQQ